MTVSQRLVLEVLDELGDSAEEIAANLELCGLKGEREVASTCPVANYLWQTFRPAHPRLTMIEVAGDIILYFGDLIAEEVDVEAPVAIESFTRQFDEGYFPQLEHK